MALPNILFYGIPRGRTRGYTRDVMVAMKPERVVIPCCGSFSLAKTASDAGIPMSAVFCGDVSLYSTALGNAITNQDWRLEVAHETGEPVEKHLTDPVSKAAAVLYTLRVLQMQHKSDNEYNRALFRELVENADAYVEQLKAQIEAYQQLLGGLTYRAQDVWVTLEMFRRDPQALILANPPRYDGGYEAMFKGLDAVFDWDEPAYEMFRERDYDRLMELLGRPESEATTLMYYATPDEDPAPMWGDPWRSVFADKPGNSRRASINWIVANRSPLDTTIARSPLTSGKAKYPLFKAEVRPAMHLWAEKVQREVGDYYRDLFIHKIDGSLGGQTVVILLDGYLLATVGAFLSNFRQQGGPVNITYAFTPYHPIYRRIHKLSLMSVCSSWFWDDVTSGELGFEFRGLPTQVQTTMLTPYPEVKTARGILDLVQRERQPDGSYKLSYYAEVVDRTCQETIAEWLEKYSKYTR